MYKTRTAHRWRLLATITVGVFLAAGSFWLIQVMNRSDDGVNVDANLKEPDYIVEKFSFVRMTPDGKPRYLFYGAKLTHVPLDDASDVVQPIMQNMAPGAAPMIINAQRARIYHAENKVDLLGSVDINRPASPQGQAMRLKTEALTVYPDEERMTSSQKVLMTLGAATATGTGLQANNANGQVDIAGRGRIVFPPKAAR
jgi:lipopolysaccharide export system protein LptC